MAAAPGAIPHARADSGVLLPYPPVFETLDAATYDLEGERVGEAHLVIERLDNGNVRMLSKTGFEGGARTILSTELAPVLGRGQHEEFAGDVLIFSLLRQFIRLVEQLAEVIGDMDLTLVTLDL